MWRNRFFNRLRVAAICLLAAIPALGQSTSGRIALIEVTAPQNYVISNRSLDLRATAKTSVGATVQSFRAAWKSNQPQIAAVNESGQVQGLLPGIAEIEAHGGGVAGRFKVHVYPLRIEITPGRLALEIGQTGALTARALNADGQPLPNVRFSWLTGLPGVASVHPTGIVAALSEGDTTVTAALDVPDPDYHFRGQAAVSVRERPPYRITRLISNDVQTRAVTVAGIIGEISYSGGDRFAFIGSLSNGSQALIVHENGALRTLAVAGEYLEAAGTIIQTIDAVAINGRGDIAAVMNGNAPPWGILVTFRGGTSAMIPWRPAPRQGLCCYCCLNIGRRSLNDNGDVAFTVWNGRANEVWLLRGNGSLEPIVSGEQSLPGIGVPNWFDRLVLGNSGAVTFAAWGAQRTGAFLWDGKQIQKLYAGGDTILGRTVTWVGEALQTESGDVYGRFGGSDFSMIASSSGGVWRQVVPGSAASGAPNIWGIHELFGARANTVVFKADSDQGSALFRVDDGRISMVARYGSGNANDWSDIRRADPMSTGDVLVQGSQGNGLSRVAVVRSGVSTPILESGRGLGRDAPTAVRWRELGTGIDPGSPVFRTAAGSLVRVAGNALQPVVSPGDVLAGDRRLINIDRLASSRNGNILFTADTTQGRSLALVRNGTSATVVSTGRIRAADQREFNLNWLSDPLAVNDKGQAAVRANFDQFEGVLFFPTAPNTTATLSSGAGTTPTVLMTRGEAAPGGGTFEYANEIAVDETGRAAFRADVSGGSRAVFLWENGQSRRILSIGDTGPNGQRVRDINNLQAAGNRFYAFLLYDQPVDQIAYYDGTTWRAVVSRGSPLSFGPALEWFHNGKFAASANGDVAFMPGVPNGLGIFIVVRKNDGRDIVVARPFDRSADGLWLSGDPFDLSLSDRGDVFFSVGTAVATGQRIVLFQAVPPLPVRSFTISNGGGSSVRTDGAGSLVQGYTRIQPDSGSTTASGIAIFGFRQNNVLVSESGVPASPLIQNGRIYAEVNGPLNTGVAMANPNSQAAVITFQITNSAGPGRSGTFTIPANKQDAFFLNGEPVNGGNAIQGTFTFSSSLPVSAVALRSFLNERVPAEFLMTTLPVVNTSLSAPGGPQFIPHFADGGGMTTQILLVNPTDSALTGVVEFYSQAGQLSRSVPYSVAGRDSARLSGAGGAVLTQGFVRVVPGGGGAAPAAMTVFTYKPDGITLSEAGVPAIQGSAFRMYVESAGIPGSAGNIESGFAVANTSNAAGTVTLELTNLDGSTTGLPAAVTRSLPGSGQIVGSLGSFFSNLPNPFRGVLRMSASSGISVVGIRSRYNELGSYLMTTTPPTNEGAAASSAELLFPHIVNGGGFTTEFIVFSGAAGQSPAGNLRFFGDDGAPLTLSLN